jgi:sec-independent protein translocase protein TatA
MTSLTSTSLIAFIGNLGMMEWAVILIIALLLFGRRLPEVGKSMGVGIREFKKGLKDVGDEVQKDDGQSRRALPPEQPIRTPENTQERSQTH